ncbi:MAG: hypothetical protein U5L74_11460 [Ideonella sp.]|nr:hypothetical protein [Ideonella sp.]
MPLDILFTPGRLIGHLGSGRTILNVQVLVLWTKPMHRALTGHLAPVH